MVKSFIKYIKEVKSETKKVDWPNKTEVKEKTVVVVISSLVIALIIASMDYTLSEGVKFLIK